MIREIVLIDEERCDGCGRCVPACHEGAIRIVDGKARLVSDDLCDGLGACLGHCPRGAITIERREAEAFEAPPIASRPTGAELASAARTDLRGGEAIARPASCPSARFVSLETRPRSSATPAGPLPAAPSGEASELTHWPVQLSLLPAGAPVLRGARLLVSADCVPVALPGFHERLLRGRAVVIGCPKFDDVSRYVAKLAEMIRANRLADILVARMEVPCCGALVAAVLEARRRSGEGVPVVEVVVGTRGQILSEGIDHGPGER